MNFNCNIFFHVRTYLLLHKCRFFSEKDYYLCRKSTIIDYLKKTREMEIKWNKNK